MEKRSVGAFAFLLLMLGALVFKLYYITQIDLLAQVAERQSSYGVLVATTRGEIFDANFTPLVDNESERLAVVTPGAQAAMTIMQSMRNKEEMDQLSALLASGHPFLYPVKNNNWTGDGITIFDVTQRYSADQLAVHLVGYLDGNHETGQTGIEAAYNDKLNQMGGSLKVRYKMDAAGQVFGQLTPEVVDTRPSQPGGVVLTIDKEMQKIVEQAATKMIQKGAVAVMDINSGDIKALVSLPDYDPNNVAKSLDDENAPFINRAFSPYNVGSTFKLVVAAAALEEGYSPTLYNYECTGVIDIDGVEFHCHNRDGHGPMNMERAIAQSCNTYFINLAQKVGSPAIVSMAQRLGFGSGTELAPSLGSQQGNLPTISELSGSGALANIGFGQGDLMATPLQIAQMVAAIANGGNSITPHLVKGFTTDGETLSEIAPAYAQSRAMSPETAQILKEFMVHTVEVGSGINAKPQSGGAGGKTGSAQTGTYKGEEEIVHAWFAGFFPAEAPKYCIVVLNEGMDSGGNFAAPVFKEIVDQINALAPQN